MNANQCKRLVSFLESDGFEETKPNSRVFKKNSQRGYPLVVKLNGSLDVYYFRNMEKLYTPETQNLKRKLERISKGDEIMTDEIKTIVVKKEVEPQPTKNDGVVEVTETEIVETDSVPISTTKLGLEDIETIKKTVAKGISNSELKMFLYIAKRYGLDPFLKEIFYSPQLKTIMTSRDGYLKIAQRNPAFEGLQSMAVRENDDFEIDVPNATVKHKYGKGDRGKVIGAWAIAYRKDRRPVIAWADLSEYKKNTTVWNTYTSAMICKVAEVMALKRQFGISGVVTKEEL